MQGPALAMRYTLTELDTFQHFRPPMAQYTVGENVSHIQLKIQFLHSALLGGGHLMVRHEPASSGAWQ